MNPGGWPTGPLETRMMQDRRDLANASADFRDAVIEAVRPILDALCRWLTRWQRP